LGLKMGYVLTEEKNPKHFISWGCGVQSTTLCVMSALGDIKKVDHIITADTGWERSVTYNIRDWYIDWLRKHGLSVHIGGRDGADAEGAGQLLLLVGVDLDQLEALLLAQRAGRRDFNLIPHLRFVLFVMRVQPGG